jgi:hypothetical protein
LLQLIARDVLPEDMQVVSFHPGLIFSDFVRDIGLKENEQDWDSRKSNYSSHHDNQEKWFAEYECSI